MDDVHSLNFQFLIIARELAKTNRATTITGLSTGVVCRIGKMTIQQLVELSESKICLFTLRLNEFELDMALKQHKSIRNSYLIAHASTNQTTSKL